MSELPLDGGLGSGVLPPELIQPLTQEIVIQPVKFGCIVADPAWSFNNKASRAGADDHYPTMEARKIEQIPVDEWAADNSHLYLWVTDTHLQAGLRVMEQWGFVYKQTIVWIKTATSFFPDDGRIILPIPGAPLYYADNYGIIWSERKQGASQQNLDNGPQQSEIHALRPEEKDDGYQRVTLSLNGKRLREYVHRLVAYTFHGSPTDPKMEIAHLNGERDDNRSDNLAWKTHAQNEADKINHGTLLFGSNHPRSKNYNPIIGLGNYFRHAHEIILFGTRGKAKTLDHSLPSVFWAPRREHSQKPDKLQDLAERLSPGPYLELFARRPRANWAHWGLDKASFER